jgi:hypothetical protein
MCAASLSGSRIKMKGAPICPWDQVSRSHPYLFRSRYISIDIGLRRLFLWYHVRSLAVYIMNTGLTRRRRDDRTSSWQRITEGT